MGENLTAPGTLKRVFQALFVKAVLPHRAGAICGVTAADHADLDQLHRGIPVEGERAIVLGAIVKHLLYNAVHITFLHHLFVFCAVKEFYINPCSVNVMRDIVSGVKDDILTAVDQFPMIAAV